MAACFKLDFLEVLFWLHILIWKKLKLWMIIFSKKKYLVVKKRQIWQKILLSWKVKKKSGSAILAADFYVKKYEKKTFFFHCSFPGMFWILILIGSILAADFESKKNSSKIHFLGCSFPLMFCNYFLKDAILAAYLSFQIYQKNMKKK